MTDKPKLICFCGNKKPFEKPIGRDCDTCTSRYEAKIVIDDIVDLLEWQIEKGVLFTPIGLTKVQKFFNWWKEVQAR